MTPPIWTKGFGMNLCNYILTPRNVKPDRNNHGTQYEMIMQDGAVLICLFDGKNDSLIGAAFIQYTKDEGHYATAAYNRALFDKPIGHAVQWLAINYLKSRSIKHYYLGELFMPERIPIGTDRESSISFFKEGFTDTVFPRYLLTFDFT